MHPKHPAARFLYYWAPAIAWMAAIFFFSSRQRLGVTQTYVYDFIIFKTLHVIEYSILFFLVFRAIHSTRLSLSRQYLYAVVFSVFYAASDEIHQLFTATRQGTVRDILIDTAGIMITYGLMRKFRKFIDRFI